MLGALLAASCADTPIQVTENVDSSTGVTIIALSRPIELITDRDLGSDNHGHPLDGYAYLGPFDTDQMGRRALYLWLEVPEDNGLPRAVKVLCDEQSLELPGTEHELGGLDLAHAAYAAPVPWGHPKVFELSQPALQCLAHARRIAITMKVPDPDNPGERFIAAGAQLGFIAQFAARIGGS